MAKQEIWENGVLINEIELPDDENQVENIETTFAIPQSAIEQLQNTLSSSETNSIAKVKTALLDFFEVIQGA